MKRFMVIGLGNFGASVAVALAEMGHRVTALDVDGEKVERVASRVDRAVTGDGTEPEVLEQIGAREAHVGIVSTGDDITASVLTAVGLRDGGVKEVHVKVISDLHARILEKVGVAGTIFPEREAAELLAKRIVSRTILNYVTLGPQLAAQETAVPAPWIGRTLRELELPRRYGVAVIAVHDYLTDEMRPIPDPDAPLKDSDTLLLAGRDEHLRRVAAIR